ncbi:MAG: hypothetical protein HYT79_05460 [Elusimicrobia bacterium]|nr:hypothetical protein [Elusimicrobiota bacterium]
MKNLRRNVKGEKTGNNAAVLEKNRSAHFLIVAGLFLSFLSFSFAEGPGSGAPEPDCPAGAEPLGDGRCMAVSRSATYIQITNPASGESYRVNLPPTPEGKRVANVVPMEDGQRAQVIYRNTDGTLETSPAFSIARAVDRGTADPALRGTPDEVAREGSVVYDGAGASEGSPSPVRPAMSGDEVLPRSASAETAAPSGSASTSAAPAPNGESGGESGESEGVDWGNHIKWGAIGAGVGLLGAFGSAALGATATFLGIGLPILIGLGAFALIYGLGASGTLDKLGKALAPILILGGVGAFIGGLLGVAGALGGGLLGGALLGGAVGLGIGLFFGLIGLLKNL